MSTYGIAGFVEGFMGGVDKAHEWKDRKRDQKRQDKLDEMDAAMHDRRIRLLDQQIAQADKAVADQKFYEDTYKSAVDATNASMGGTEAAGGGMGLPGPAGAPAAVPASPGATSGLPPPTLGGVLPLGIPQGLEGRPKAAPPGMPSAAQLREQAAGSQAGVVNAPVVGPAGGPAPAAGPAPVASNATAPGGMTRLPDGTIVAPAPRGIIADELAAAGQGTGVRYIPKERQIPTSEEAAKRKAAEEAAAAKAAQDMELERNRRVRDEDGPVPLSWRKAADDKIGAITRERTAANPNPALDMAPRPPTRDAAAMTGKDAMPALSDAWQSAVKPGPGAAPRGKAPASAPPEVKQMAETAATAMAATTTPAMEATAAAASRGLPEAGKKPTEENRAKFAGDFMDEYRKVGAPMVYEALLSRGEFEKAEAFRSFLERDETKAGMDNWARAAFAASVGDMDTFATEIMDAYDRLDYFPDGTTIDREASGFTRDKDGNITGAKLTFKDAKTGNTWDQVFTDPNDLVRMGITLLAPEQAFEYYFEEQQAAAEASRGIKKDQAEADKEQQKRVDEVAKLIFENSKDISGVPQITYGEAVRQAQEQLSGAPAAPAGDAATPPIARRPGG